MKEIILQLEGIQKQFPGIQALNFRKNDTIEFRKGEIHALIGENGAGKSTLAHIIAGIYQKDFGKMILEGDVYVPNNIRDAEKKGIAIILQEPGLVPTITVADNIFIARESVYKKFGFIVNQKQVKLTKEAIEGIITIDPTIITRDLSYEEQKLIELSRALSLKPKVLIIDETSAALSLTTRDILFSETKNMREQGGIVIFVSHQLDEVIDLSDRITVLKDGQFVTTLENKNLSKDELAALMVGGRLLTKRPSRKEVTTTKKDVLLSLKNLTRTGAFEKISFDLHKGEILGIGGIAGCGKAELARVIFGDLKPNSGEISIMNSLVKLGTIRDAISSGIAYVPKNRDKEGLILRASIRQNISLPILRRLSIFGWLKLRREKELTQQLIANLRIKCKNYEDQIISLSGGNRQKVVLAKWLAEQASIYVLDNPTRGVDVGAKQEIYQFIEKLADQGAAILLVSDEMPELLNLSDTIIILRHGQISQSFYRGSFPTEQTLINHMI